ncbi:urea carboxylase-associated protein 1 [Syntrophobotulus glycolicus DSM 8271]|uniref:Urea carboxylase-associated protein 1 n=1 Tax=Syntrophobotulus glycolicus (strain DSM 8271 / FlGlyR) TaxID=645991 RepID=F0T195_SYNGF|nr:urea amidolyase associated protein UAAP2 [Syntrophobotulus glycolicus]ADY55159.1 urea carboxylase-associated protein 1 [Syntrophobotulus glycolicus DSM 8271]
MQGSFNRKESSRREKDAVYTKIIPAGEGWLHELEPEQVLRIVDMEGNQAVDTMFYDADNPQDHYSVTQTITGQANIFLTAGSVLRAESGKPLLTIIADTCGRHDTLGGACSAQSNTVRYSRDIQFMHNCRDTFINELAKSNGLYQKRDLAPNINFFMNVPVTPEGGLEFADGVSASGCYVELRAECRVSVLISNCPQLNNPCNAYNPTPIQLLIWSN